MLLQWKTVFDLPMADAAGEQSLALPSSHDLYPPWLFTSPFSLEIS
jgi:hypothetical protein